MKKSCLCNQIASVDLLATRSGIMANSPSIA
jgi:hypothetical protein